MPEEQNFFVQIQDVPSIRRPLLENIKQIIKLLQRFEKFKELRAAKVEEIMKLKRVSKEISGLFVKLKKELPESGLRLRARKAKGKEKIKGKAKEEVKTKPVTPMSELDKLESELKAIESKIGRVER